MSVYGDHLTLFIVLMYVFSFVSYNPSIIEDGNDQEDSNISTNSSSTTTSKVVIKLAIIILACLLVLTKLIMFAFNTASYDDDKDDNKANCEFYILHFDGSDSNQNRKGGAGCIIRDHLGDLVVAQYYNLDYLYPDCHVAIVEAFGLLIGLKLAKHNNIKLGLILGDSQEVVNRVLGHEKKKPSASFLSNIIEEVKYELVEQSIDPKSRVKLIGREGNRVADKLASLGTLLHEESRTFTRGDRLPFQVASLIEHDKIDWVFLYQNGK